MANSTTSITSTYAGEFAGKYVSAALLSGNTLANNLITVKPNVKFKEVMKKVASTSNFNRKNPTTRRIPSEFRAL